MRRIRDAIFSDRLRTVGAFAAIALVLWFLWPRPDAGKPAHKQVLTFWRAGTMQDAFLEAIERFEHDNPDIEVIVGNAAIRNATDDPQRFLTGVAGGVPPDVIYFDRYAVAEWASRGAFEALDGYLDADLAAVRDIEQQLSDARGRQDHAAAEQLASQLAARKATLLDPADFFPATWNEARYDRDGDGRAEQYGIPATTDDRALYYNESRLKQDGFVDEQGNARPPRTWAEVLTKRVETTAIVEKMDSRVVNEEKLVCPDVDLLAAGVEEGDHLSLHTGGVLRVATVRRVVSPHELVMIAKGSLPAAAYEGGTHCKIFDGQGYLVKLSRWDRQGRLWRIGLAPVSNKAGNSWLYLFGWQNGGRFMTEDGRTCTLDDPRIVGALDWLVDCYDALGGYAAVAAMESGYQGGWLDPFIQDKVAMRIDGNDFLNVIAQYRRQMDFGVAPAPMPAERLAAGVEPISWMGGYAYAIPSTARNKDAAWRLVRWMASPEAQMMQERMRRDIALSQGQLFVPGLNPRKMVNDAFERTFVNGGAPLPKRYAAAYTVFRDLLPRAYHRPVTPVGQLLWMEHRRATERALTHDATPADALDRGTRVVQAQLERVFAPPPGAPVRWSVILIAYAAALALTAAGIVGHAFRRSRTKGYFRRQWYAGWAAATPWMIGFIVFVGGPMVFSLVMSFTQYDVLNAAHWAGLANYRELAGDPLFYKSLYNTAFMALGVPLGIVAGLALAMLLDANVRGLSTYRTLFYLPAIVPAVAASILWLWVFHPTGGLVNTVLGAIGMNDWLVRWGLDAPLKWLQTEGLAKPALLIMGLWGAGASMLIWLAGLKSVPEELYEAASIDGAGPLRRFLYVTLPMLTPYIFFNLIMGTIGVFQIFTQAYIMTEGGPNDATMFYAYNLFNQAFRYLRMGYASALAWVLFAIIMILTLIQLKTSKRWVHYAND